MLHFESDYMEGCCPEILRRLKTVNFEKLGGYGEDAICASAREKIRAACDQQSAGVWFLTGGTQANAVVIDALLRPWEGVIAAETGHIAQHEAGAVEHGGHKVLTIPGVEGRLRAADLRAYMEAFLAEAARDHLVQPGMVYISHPTEYGTLYGFNELCQLRAVCDDFGLKLYLDGARLGYGLAAPGAELTLPDVARLTDVFTIGGTKVGALFGEAVVAQKPETLGSFFPLMKQHGAVLAKGWLLGVQFDELFTDGLYMQGARRAVEAAALLRHGLLERGVELYIDSPTNQVFPVFEDAALERLGQRIGYTLWERLPGGRSVVRLATSWATKEPEVELLLDALDKALQTQGVRHA